MVRSRLCAVVVLYGSLTTQGYFVDGFGGLTTSTNTRGRGRRENRSAIGSVALLREATADDDATVSCRVRRRWLETAAAAVGWSVVVSASRANAAVPTFDDYESTTNGATTNGKTSTTSSQETLVRQLATSAPTLDSVTAIVDFGDASVTSVTALESLVKSADWAAVRSVLRSEGNYQGNVLGMARKPYFGLKGGDKALRKLLTQSADVDKLEDSRSDLAFSLSQLEDFALENRSVFFNSLDRKQVEELIAETGFKEKSSEGESLLADAKARALELQQIVRKL